MPGAMAPRVEAAAPGDLEECKPSSAAQEIPTEALPKEYYAVYGFSLFVVLFGMLHFFFPFAKTHTVSSVVSMGGLAVGAFLMFNADLLVTYLRLMREMERFKANNKQYRGNLKEQKKNILKLKETKKALEQLDELAHSRIEDISSELSEMNVTARDRVRSTIANVLIVCRPSQEDISAGKDLDQVIRVFKHMYARAFPLLIERFGEMRKGFEASNRWKKVQSVSINRMKFILASVIFDDINTIKDRVCTMVEEESDARATGWYNSSRSQMSFEQFASEHSEPRTGEVAVKVAADEADFAAGRGAKDQEDAEWADAIAFADK